MNTIFTIAIAISIIIEHCESAIRYFLYDSGTTDWTELPPNGLLPHTYKLWDPDSDLKLLIHGYNSKVGTSDFYVFDRHFMLILAKEYGRYDNQLNIIAVDWSSLSTFPSHEYPLATSNVRPAAVIISNYLFKLLENGGIKDLDSIHILGLSLGAHLAGAVGFQLKLLTGGGNISRITGFDPAGPGFTTWNGYWPADMSEVLDYTDADFVDIIHTSMGTFGTDLQTGDVDFYPNGGVEQNYQCNVFQDKFESCSHQMSVLYFAQALRQPYIYNGCPCDSYNDFVWGHCPCSSEGTGKLIGELTTPVSLGRYYLTIKDPLSKQSFE